MSLLAACLSLGLNLALALTPPPTTAVAYDLSGFKVENGLIHVNDGADPIDPSSLGKALFLDNNKSIIVQTSEQNQIRLMQRIGETKGTSQIIRLQMKYFLLPVNELTKLDIKHEQIDILQKPVTRKQTAQSDRDLIQWPIADLPIAAFEIDQKKVSLLKQIAEKYDHGELGSETFLFLSGRKGTVLPGYYEVNEATHEVKTEIDQSTLFQEPVRYPEMFPQQKIAVTSDLDQGQVEIEYADLSPETESDCMHQLAVHQKIKLGQSLMIVDLSTILDFSNDGFPLSRHGEVQKFKPPKPKDEGKRRIFVLTPTLVPAAR